MGADLDFEVLDWLDDVQVLKIRVYGRLPAGQEIDKEITLHEPKLISEVHEIVAKINAGTYRT